MHPKKLVIVTRCQDCPLDSCAQRQMCGPIPPGCPLPDAPLTLTPEEPCHEEN